MYSEGLMLSAYRELSLFSLLLLIYVIGMVIFSRSIWTTNYIISLSLFFLIGFIINSLLFFSVIDYPGEFKNVFGSSRYVLPGEIRSDVMDFTIIENFNIYMYPIGLCASFALYRKSRLFSFTIGFIAVFSLLVSFKKIYLIVFPILYLLFIKLERLNKKKMLMLLGVILISLYAIVLLVYNIYKIDILQMWYERFLYIRSSVDPRLYWTDRMLTSLLMSNNILFGNSDFSYYALRNSLKQAVYFDPSFIYMVYLTGFLGLTLFIIMHIKWLTNIIRNFVYLKKSPGFLFSIYSYIFISLTILQYHYIFVGAAGCAYWYWIGYLFSFIEKK